jgi:hypothetical protein
VPQELFLSSLLPDRKLRVLEQQPLQELPPGKEGERCLLLWGVEDAVKRRYQQYVQLLEKCRYVWVHSGAGPGSDRGVAWRGGIADGTNKPPPA